MQNVLGSCLAVGILAGGFALTGDLGRLAEHGRRVLEATDVPDDEAPIPVAGSVVPHPTPTVQGAGPTGFPAPRTGIDAVDVAALAAGSRIVVWIEGAGPGTRRLALDVVEPAAGEVLVSEPAAPAAAGQPAVAPAPPRRAIVAGPTPAGRLVRGGPLTLESRGIAGTGGRETLGPILGLDVSR